MTLDIESGWGGGVSEMSTSLQHLSVWFLVWWLGTGGETLMDKDMPLGVDSAVCLPPPPAFDLRNELTAGASALCHLAIMDPVL